MIIALLAACVILFLMAAHPFSTYPLSLAAIARLRPRAIGAGRVPATAALCVCAYNEERVIRAKVENMLSMRRAFPALELLVYVDAATDRTAEIVREFGDRVTLVVSPVRTGKTHGMNTLVARSSADCIVCSDANVIFAEDAVPALLAPFADPAIGVVCGHLMYSDAPASRATGAARDDTATAATGSLYWRLEERIKRLESASGSVIGADGSIFAVRRELYCPAPAHLIDDMYVSLMALCNGSRVVRADDACAYEDSVSRPAEEFRRKIRISCQAFNVHRALRPRLRQLAPLDRYKYVSHKFLRWLTVYLLGGSAACFLAAVAVAERPWLLLAVLVMGAGAACVIMQARRGPAAALRSILAAFLGTGIGCWRSVRGDRFQTWTPPASTRLASRVPQATATVETVQ